MKCLGRNSDNHCCHLGEHGVCEYLLEDVDGFRWTCGLRRELGSWGKVLKDERYIENVQPKLDEIGPDLTCKNYPNGDYECRQCYGVKHG